MNTEIEIAEDALPPIMDAPPSHPTNDDLSHYYSTYCRMIDNFTLGGANLSDCADEEGAGGGGGAAGGLPMSLMTLIQVRETRQIF